MPSRDMLVRSVTPPGAMGKVFGFVSTGFSIGGIVSPLLFGYLLDHGQPSLVFQVVAAFMVEIGRAHVCTPVTNAHLVCRLLLENKKNRTHICYDSILLTIST